MGMMGVRDGDLEKVVPLTLTGRQIDLVMYTYVEGIITGIDLDHQEVRKLTDRLWTQYRRWVATQDSPGGQELSDLESGS